MIIFLSHPDASVVPRSKPAIEPFLYQALDSSYQATPDGRVADSPPSLWITGAAENFYRRPTADNRCWRSLSVGKICCRGDFVSPSALKRSPSHRGHPGCSCHRSSANPRPHRRCRPHVRYSPDSADITVRATSPGLCWRAWHSPLHRPACLHRERHKHHRRRRHWWCCELIPAAADLRRCVGCAGHSAQSCR